MEQKKEVEKKQSEKLRCPKCSSSFGYLRMKEKIWCCRSCGNVERIDKEEK